VIPCPSPLPPPHTPPFPRDANKPPPRAADTTPTLPGQPSAWLFHPQITKLPDVETSLHNRGKRSAWPGGVARISSDPRSRPGEGAFGRFLLTWPTCEATVGLYSVCSRAWLVLIEGAVAIPLRVFLLFSESGAAVLRIRRLRPYWRHTCPDAGSGGGGVASRWWVAMARWPSRGCHLIRGACTVSFGHQASTRTASAREDVLSPRKAVWRSRPVREEAP
jgi:hypothetical protein